MLIPPHGFERVSSELYVSTLPHPRSVKFLRLLAISSVIHLAPKDPAKLELSSEVKEWLESVGHCRWLHVEKVKGQGKVVLTLSTAKAALETILAAPPPTLVTGFEGMESVALLRACLRKLQCWDMSSIQSELARSIPLSLDALHIRFVNQFCSLSPVSMPVPRAHVSAHSPLEDARQSATAQSATLSLPSPDKLPKWLFLGFRSPSALLYGGQYEQASACMRELTWHPTMRIAYPDCELLSERAMDRHLPLDGDYDALPTPRCHKTAASSPERPDPLSTF